ncbi:MAG: aminotransferase class I/II-fold pyridoxal phosphate-dependent enzyme [Actinomycetota bacterium]|nr:aminotransferase class I/II-fold pyridoxal phosphate-dependent enzyme [Actinomycetota bacterium]
MRSRSRPAGGPHATVRLDLNESAYGPLPSVSAALREGLADVHHYPDFRPDRTRAQIADHLGIAADQVTVGAGATGVALAVFGECRRRARVSGVRSPSLVTSVPTFDGYPILAHSAGLRIDPVGLSDVGGVDLPALRAAVTADTMAVVICTPHNPTGAVLTTDALRTFIEAIPPGVLIVIDEAYVEFCDDPPDVLTLVADHDDVLVLRTFSKAHGLAALRVGYAFGSAPIIESLRGGEIPFAVGSAAIAAVPAALNAHAELAQRVRAMRQERRRLQDMLAAIGCPTLPSQGNFLFVPGDEGVEIGRLLRSCGVLTKEVGRDGIRITVGDADSTDCLIQALRVTAMTA